MTECECKTPEDRALHVIDGGNLPIGGKYCELVRGAALLEIRAAVEAEREACAKVVDNIGEYAEQEGTSELSDAALVIAAAIRARSEGT